MNNNSSNQNTQTENNSTKLPTKGIEINVVEPKSDSVIQGFELGSYQDREQNTHQSQALTPQSTPINDASSPMNDTNTTPTNK